MNEDDAIRDMVRAIRGNPEANEALDRLIIALRQGGQVRLLERVAIERAAA